MTVHISETNRFLLLSIQDQMSYGDTAKKYRARVALFDALRGDWDWDDNPPTLNNLKPEEALDLDLADNLLAELKELALACATQVIGKPARQLLPLLDELGIDD
jgi:hypothetical protein